MVSTAGSGPLDPLKPAGFQFGVLTSLSVHRLQWPCERGVRAVQQPSEQHASLADPWIRSGRPVRIKIGTFLFTGSSQRRSRAQRIELSKMVVSDMDAAVGALSQRFP